MTADVSENTQRSDVRVDQSSTTVGGHIACASCAYDLHGLPGDGKCPECGWPVAQTLAAGRNDRLWLVAINSGVQALLVGHYILIASAVLCPVLPLGICFFIILVLGGAIELGTRHPLTPLEDTSGAHSGNLLGSGLAACILAMMLIGAPMLGLPLLALGVACLGAGMALLWRRFARIMARDLSGSAAGLGRALAWSTAGAGVLLVLAIVLQILAVAGSSAAAFDFASLLAVLAALAWLVNVIMAIITLSIGRDALKRAMRTAEAIERSADVKPPPVTIR